MTREKEGTARPEKGTNEMEAMKCPNYMEIRIRKWFLEGKEAKTNKTTKNGRKGSRGCKKDKGGERHVKAKIDVEEQRKQIKKLLSVQAGMHRQSKIRKLTWEESKEKEKKEGKRRRGRKQARMRVRPAPARRAARLQPTKAAVLGGREAEATAAAKAKVQMQKWSQELLTTRAKARGRRTSSR